MKTPKRIVIWFSAGVTSAIAAKLAWEQWRDSGVPVLLVNTDTGSEDEDNYRFMADVSAWLGLPVTVIRSEKFANTFEVYDHTGFMKNQWGAKCTTELKKKPRQKFQQSGDLQIFGFDINERGRAHRFVENNPEVWANFPLIDVGLDKATCRQMLVGAGVQEPRTYGEGFQNANCLNFGCVKGGIGYWNHIRKVRPHVFKRMAKKERELGYALLKQMVDGAYTPVFLDELSPTAGNYNTEPSFQCGLFCGEF